MILSQCCWNAVLRDSGFGGGLSSDSESQLPLKLEHSMVQAQKAKELSRHAQCFRALSQFRLLGCLDLRGLGVHELSRVGGGGGEGWGPRWFRACGLCVSVYRFESSMAWSHIEFRTFRT